MPFVLFIPLLIILVPMGLLMALFIFIVFRMIGKTKKDYWIGQVTDKLYNEKRQDHHKMSHFYTLVVKTTSGQVRKVAVTSQMYESCSVGDTLEKPLGALNPVKKTS